MRTSWPSLASSLGRAPPMSASPPTFTNGSPSGLTKKIFSARTQARTPNRAGLPSQNCPSPCLRICETPRSEEAPRMAQRIWFITGVSSGLGRSLAEAVAARGDIAVGTLRQDAQLAAYNALAPGRPVGVKLDVNDHPQVRAIVQQVIAQSGRIDVLVNNAGYGVLGAVEEVSDAETRAQMETNFFGAL